MAKKLDILTFVFFLLTYCTHLRADSPIRILLQENRLEEAIAICRQFEVLNANDLETQFACAWVYFRTDRIERGEKILEQTKANASQPEYQMLSAFGRALRKKYDMADSILESLVKNNKGTKVERNALALRAEIKEMRGQLPSAAFIYTGVVREDPSNARAHWALGRHYKNRGDIRLAIHHLEKTAQLWPKHIESRYELALLYLENRGAESVQDAAIWLSEAYKLNKADSKVLEQLGVVFEKKGKIPEAIYYWQKAVEIKKDSVLSQKKLNDYFGEAIENLIANKKWKEALAKLDGAGKSITTQPKYILYRGILLHQLATTKSQAEQAIAELQKYLKLFPTDATALRELGECYLGLKQTDQAYHYFVKAVNADPTNGMNYSWLAVVLGAKREWEAARDAWRKAVELLKDPVEQEKANRSLATVEKKISAKIKDGKSNDE